MRSGPGISGQEGGLAVQAATGVNRDGYRESHSFDHLRRRRARRQLAGSHHIQASVASRYVQAVPFQWTITDR
jgi:hypothetical protein